MQLYDFKEIQERVILVGVQTDIGDDVEASLDELQELAETAGAETAAKVIQNREAVHPGSKCNSITIYKCYFLMLHFFTLRKCFVPFRYQFQFLCFQHIFNLHVPK